MKKIVLSLALLATGVMYGQTVNGIKIEDIPAKYVQIVATAKAFKPFQVTIYLDYGQISKIKEVQKGTIKNPDGSAKSFNGVMGAINFLNTKGFDYVDKKPIAVGAASVYHIILENKN